MQTGFSIDAVSPVFRQIGRNNRYSLTVRATYLGIHIFFKIVTYAVRKCNYFVFTTTALLMANQKQKQKVTE